MKSLDEPLRFAESEFLLPGLLALVRDGRCVYIGKIGDPIEDAEFDKIVLHPSDVKKLAHWIEEERTVRRLPPP